MSIDEDQRGRVDRPVNLLIQPILLPMVWQEQQQSNWCWAACTSMVCQFYIPKMFSTQCSVATITINHDRLLAGQTSIDCCNPTVAETTGNSTWGLLPPLALTGHLANLVWTSMDYAALLNELGNGRPICVQIQWRGGGGHFIVVNGVNYIPNPDIVWVEDPGSGPAIVAYSELVNNNYQGSGTWFETFTTCSCVPH
jgi:hypothetical protein